MDYISIIKKNRNIIVKGNRIYLRTLNVSDASKEYIRWINNPQIHKFLETKYTSIDELKAYIRQKKTSNNCLFYGIFILDNNLHIGNIKLEPIDFENKKAVLGILIGNREYWGKGYCTEAVLLLTANAFIQLNLDFIELGVISYNIAARKCYEKAGFREIEKKDNNGIIMGISKKNSIVLS